MHAAYDGIYLDLKHSILEGVYRYKELLPSESMLVKRYGCAHNTVRKALGILAREGYVQPIHGKGVRVIWRPSPTDEATVRYEPCDLARLGDNDHAAEAATRTQLIRSERLVADAPCSELTGFDEGEELVRLECVCYLEDTPLVRTTSYYRYDMVAGAAEPCDIETSLCQYLEAHQQKRFVTSRRRLTVEHVNDCDRELLDVDDTSCVVVSSILTFDNEGFLCEATFARQHPRSFSLEQTFVRARIGNG